MENMYWLLLKLLTTSHGLCWQMEFVRLSWRYLSCHYVTVSIGHVTKGSLKI